MRFLAIVFFAASSCAEPSKPVPVAPQPVGDASALLDAGPDASACALACSDYVAAHCKEARPDCVTVCEVAVRDGMLNPPPRSVGVCPR